MEISDRTHQFQQPLAPTKSAPVKGGQELPEIGKELPPEAVKAAPKVPEFELKDLDKAVEDLQEFIEGLGRNLSFTRDESLGKNIITVLDTQTNQIVRQIPGEEVLAISRQIKEDVDELRAGILLKGGA